MLDGRSCFCRAGFKVEASPLTCQLCGAFEWCYADSPMTNSSWSVKSSCSSQPNDPICVEFGGNVGASTLRQRCFAESACPLGFCSDGNAGVLCNRCWNSDSGSFGKDLLHGDRKACIPCTEQLIAAVFIFIFHILGMGVVCGRIGWATKSTDGSDFSRSTLAFKIVAQHLQLMSCFRNLLPVDSLPAEGLVSFFTMGLPLTEMFECYSTSGNQTGDLSHALTLLPVLVFFPLIMGLNALFVAWLCKRWRTKEVETQYNEEYERAAILQMQRQEATGEAVEVEEFLGPIPVAEGLFEWFTAVATPMYYLLLIPLLRVYFLAFNCVHISALGEDRLLLDLDQGCENTLAWVWGMVGVLTWGVALPFAHFWWIYRSRKDVFLGPSSLKFGWCCHGYVAGVPLWQLLVFSRQFLVVLFACVFIGKRAALVRLKPPQSHGQGNDLWGDLSLLSPYVYEATIDGPPFHSGAQCVLIGLVVFSYTLSHICVKPLKAVKFYIFDVLEGVSLISVLAMLAAVTVALYEPSKEATETFFTTSIVLQFIMLVMFFLTLMVTSGLYDRMEEKVGCLGSIRVLLFGTREEWEEEFKDLAHFEEIELKSDSSELAGARKRKAAAVAKYRDLGIDLDANTGDGWGAKGFQSFSRTRALGVMSVGHAQSLIDAIDFVVSKPRAVAALLNLSTHADLHKLAEIDAFEEIKKEGFDSLEVKQAVIGLLELRSVLTPSLESLRPQRLIALSVMTDKLGMFRYPRLNKPRLQISPHKEFNGKTDVDELIHDTTRRVLQCLILDLSDFHYGIERETTATRFLARGVPRGYRFDGLTDKAARKYIKNRDAQAPLNIDQDREKVLESHHQRVKAEAEAEKAEQDSKVAELIQFAEAETSQTALRKRIEATIIAHSEFKSLFPKAWPTDPPDPVLEVERLKLLTDTRIEEWSLNSLPESFKVLLKVSNSANRVETIPDSINLLMGGEFTSALGPDNKDSAIDSTTSEMDVLVIDPPIDVRKNAFTIECWCEFPLKIKTEDISWQDDMDSRVLCCTDYGDGIIAVDGRTGYMGVYFEDNNALVPCAPASKHSKVNTEEYTIGWYFLCVTVMGRTQLFYVDGELIGDMGLDESWGRIESIGNSREGGLGWGRHSNFTLISGCLSPETIEWRSKYEHHIHNVLAAGMVLVAHKMEDALGPTLWQRGRGDIQPYGPAPDQGAQFPPDVIVDISFLPPRTDKERTTRCFFVRIKTDVNPEGAEDRRHREFVRGRAYGYDEDRRRMVKSQWLGPELIKGPGGSSDQAYGIDTTLGAAVVLSHSLKIGKQWTIVANIYLPLARYGAQFRALISGEKDIHVGMMGEEGRPYPTVFCTIRGSWVRSAGQSEEDAVLEQTSYPAGKNTHLSEGWHVIHVVGADGATYFFADGAPVGFAKNFQSTDDVHMLGNFADTGEMSYGAFSQLKILKICMTPEAVAADYSASQQRRQAAIVGGGLTAGLAAVGEVLGHGVDEVIQNYMQTGYTKRLWLEVADGGDTITLEPPSAQHGLAPFGIDAAVEGPYGEMDAFDPSVMYVRDLEGEVEAPEGGGFRIKPRIELDLGGNVEWSLSAWIKLPVNDTGTAHALVSGKHGQVHVGCTAKGESLGVFTIEEHGPDAVVIDPDYPPFTSAGGGLQGFHAGGLY
eukprot:GHVN01090304.1.p1 GENE.GHVN01090304.1~~GHVN01090304.1.p1  ORF type:complete len:1652 (+),score=222.88 GHVN01090304.1:1119-6074(+)